MPIYDYKCSDCNTVFEVLVSTANTTETQVCSKCGSRKTSKTIAASGYRISSGSPSVPAGALSGCSSRPGFS